MFLGFPIWWYTAPTIINTFLEVYDFTSKTIIPFATSGSNGFGKTAADLTASAPARSSGTGNFKWATDQGIPGCLRLSYRAEQTSSNPEPAEDTSVSNVSETPPANQPSDSESPESEAPEEPDDSGKKIFIVYFSATNNTENITSHLESILDADLYEVVPETPYTSADLNYNDSSSRSSQEMNDPYACPEISGSVENMEQYNVIFLGYPNWWASIPMPVASFLEEYDFSGKTIIPFCSHGGSWFGQSLTAITKLVPNTVLGERLAAPAVDGLPSAGE